MARSTSSTSKAPKGERILLRILILAAIAIVVIALLSKITPKLSKDTQRKAEQTTTTTETASASTWQSKASQEADTLVIYEEGATIRFENQEALEAGLKQLKEETGIDVVIDVRATEMTDPSKGRTFYYSKFADERHVVLFVYPNWSKTAYFTFGEDVGEVLSTDDIIRLIKLTGYSLDGEVWQEAIENFLLS